MLRETSVSLILVDRFIFYIPFCNENSQEKEDQLSTSAKIDDKQPLPITQPTVSAGCTLEPPAFLTFGQKLNI